MSVETILFSKKKLFLPENTNEKKIKNKKRGKEENREVKINLIL